jgi:predicted DNA-binding transcriptional regulator YafY
MTTMQLPETLTEEQHRAIVEAIRILASRGRQLRLEREARERAERENQAGDTAPEPSQGAADIPETAADPNELDVEDNATQRISRFIDTEDAVPGSV